MHVAVFYLQVWTDTQIDEVIFGARFQHVPDPLKNGVKLFLIVLHGVGVQHAVMIDACIRPVRYDAVLEGSK